MAAVELGVDRHCMPLLVRVCGIKPKPMRFNGNGLTRSDINKLKRKLSLASPKLVG